MNAREAAWHPAEEAASALEPEAGLIGRLDMAGFGRSLATVLARSAWHPAAVAGAVLRFAADLAMTWSAAATLRVRAASTTPAGQDKRFTDPAWDDNPAYFAIRQSYLAARRLSEELLQAGRGERVSDAKAHLAARALGPGF